MIHYFFSSDTVDESIFELLRVDEEPKKSSFERYYLDSETFFTKEGSSYSLHGGGTNKLLKIDIAECLKTSSKVHLKGECFRLKDLIFLDLELPWKTKVLISERPLNHLESYPGNLASYFFRRSVGIFAGPGTGKTCLARALSNYISIHLGISCDNCYEYATTHISRYGPPKFEDQAQMLFSQWEREEDIRGNKQVTISDCPHPLNYVYSRMLYQAEKKTDPRHLLWIEEKSVAGLDQFDTKIFLPPMEDRCKEDGIRLHRFEESKKIGDEIRGFLDLHSCDYIVYDDGDLEKLVGRIFYLNSLCTIK